MSKVEMSLREYDELIEKLRTYERIIEQLTTPSVESYEYEYFQKHTESNLYVYSRVEDKSLLNFLKDKMLKNIEEDSELYEKFRDYEPEFDTVTVKLFTLTHPKEETTEEG